MPTHGPDSGLQHTPPDPLDMQQLARKVLEDIWHAIKDAENSASYAMYVLHDDDEWNEYQVEIEKLSTLWTALRDYIQAKWS